MIGTGTGMCTGTSRDTVAPWVDVAMWRVAATVVGVAADTGGRNGPARASGDAARDAARMEFSRTRTGQKQDVRSTRGCFSANSRYLFVLGRHF